MVKRKRGIALLLVGLIGIFAGCGDRLPSSSFGDGGYYMEKETMPTYVDGAIDYKIGMWVGIPEQKTILGENGELVRKEIWTDEEILEQYQMIKEAGFTISCIGAWSDEHKTRLLEAAEAVGVKQLVSDEKLNAILLNTSISDEEALVQAQKRVEEMRYHEYECFYGNRITDEPQTSEYAALAVGSRRYKQLLPDKMYYLNLFPVGATHEQLGIDDYETYLDGYNQLELDYVCYDKYPLRPGPNGTTQMIDDFLYNMQLCQDMETNNEVWTFLQAMGFAAMKDPDCVEDFRIQANAALAYGIKGIKWFCYFSPGYGGQENFSPAIIGVDGVKTAKYEYVKEFNLELSALASAYYSFEWERAMNMIGTDNAMGENVAFNYVETDNTHKRIKSFTSKKDTICGVFKDAEGRDAFMVSNYDLPSSKEVNTVEIEFYNCTKIIYYVNGEKSVIDVTDGKLKLDLKAGDGAFVIPLYL